MARRYYSNFAPQLTTSGAMTNIQTTLTVSGTFAGWPSSYPFFAVINNGQADVEIVSVTNIVGAVATIVRGQDGTTGQSHAAGATFDQAVVRQDLDEASAHVNASTGVHGVSGSVVGTTDTQTLSGKTIALGSNTVSGTTAQFNTALSDGDFATLAGTETLTNKTVTDNSFVVQDNGDNTKKFRFEATNITTGTTRVLTVPDADLTLVGTSTQQNLSAKIVSFRDMVNEAGAGSQAAGTVVYLSAPTGAGNSAGLYVSLGGGSWRPVDPASTGSAVQELNFTPGGNLDTPGAGTATWMTLGNVTVPAWATRAVVNYAINGAMCPSGADPNVSYQFKIGAVGGADRRLLGCAVTSQRFYQGRSDLLTGLSSGSQSVTIASTWTSGATVFRVDANSTITASFHFLP